MKRLLSVILTIVMLVLPMAETVAFAQPESVTVADSAIEQLLPNEHDHTEQVATGELAATSGTCGTNLSWTLYDDGVLEIDGTGAMKNWNTKTIPWYDYCENICYVKIGDGVTSIGNYAFYYCEALERVDIPASVTSISSSAFTKGEYISIYGFKGTYAEKFADKNSFPFSSIEEELTAIASGKCGDNVTWSLYEGGTLVVSGTGAMYDWVSEEEAPWHHTYKESIKTVIVSEGVTYLGKRAFRYCNITNAIIPDSVTAIGASAFEGCEKLQKFVISNSVTSIGDEAFYYCIALEKITIGKNVTSIGTSAFNSCKSLTEITIPKGVETIGNDAFADCDEIEIHGYSNTYAETYATENGIPFVALDVVDEGTCGESLTWKLYKDGLLMISGTGDMDNWKSTTVPWYDYCEDISYVIIGDGVTSIGNYAFYYCESLERVDIPASVTSIGASAFKYCDNVTIYCYRSSYAHLFAFSNDIPYVCVDGEGDETNSALFYGSCGESLTWEFYEDGLLKISGTGAMTNWEKAASVPWYNLNDLILSVEICEGATSVGDYAFYHCFDLENVVVGNSITVIGNYAFRGCESFVSIVIPDSVTSVGKYSFSDCSNLESVKLGNAVTSIGVSAFSDCESITSIVIPDSVTNIAEDTFSGCSNLESISLGNSVTSIGGNAFGYCVSLSNFVIPDSVENIGLYAFEGCESIISIEIPASVVNIGGGAFSYCTNLEKITVDENNLDYSSDANGVLYNKNKTYLIQYPAGNSAISYEIPDSVISIGDDAFNHCENLEKITIPASVTSFENYVFDSCPNLTIYGYRNSYAKFYANYCGIPFVALDEEYVSVTGVSLNKTELLLEVGATEVLVATVAPANATNVNVRWKSSDTSVVTVENGLVKAVGEGTATITVTTSDGYKTATCLVAVTKQGSLNPDAKATVTLSNTTGRAGDKVSVIVSLNTDELINTIGISGITYDNNVLTFDSFTQYDEVKEISILSSFDKNTMAVVIAFEEPQTFNGNLFEINFIINENASDGENVIDLSSLIKLNSTEIVVNNIAGIVTVISEILGDVNLDESVDMNDAVLLLQYSLFPELYPIDYKGSLDFTKDGFVDMNDAVLLLQYSLFPDLYPIE